MQTTCWTVVGESTTVFQCEWPDGVHGIDARGRQFDQGAAAIHGERAIIIAAVTEKDVLSNQVQRAIKYRGAPGVCVLGSQCKRTSTVFIDYRRAIGIPDHRGNRQVGISIASDVSNRDGPDVSNGD